MRVETLADIQRTFNALSEVSAEQQLIWQLIVSAPLLLFAAPFFGGFMREIVESMLEH